MTELEQELLETEEYVCVNPEIGEDLHDFLDHTLPEPRRKRFENHLVFCRKCQEDLAYLRWIMTNVKARELRNTFEDRGLTITAVFDGDRQHLHHLYQPLSERLAAAANELHDDIIFPYVVEYADGQVVGEFRRRTELLFFYLKKSPMPCQLIYTPGDAPAKSQTFEFHEGEEKRLGLFQDFVSSETIQGMLKGIQRFQVVLKQQK